MTEIRILVVAWPRERRAAARGVHPVALHPAKNRRPVEHVADGAVAGLQGTE
jgi:hypothetical protein